MSLLKIDRSSDVRTDELSTIAEVAKTFVSFGSPRVVIFFSAVFAALRLAVGGFGWFDPVSYTHLTLPTNREV